MTLHLLIESLIRTTGNLPLKHSWLALARNSLPHLIVSILFIDAYYNELTNLSPLLLFVPLTFQLDFGMFVGK